jgi:hypothetical protein
MRAIRMLRSRWRALETRSRLGLHGHKRGNPGHRQGHDLTDHRASPRPYQVGEAPLCRGSAMSAEGILFEPFAESPESPLELELG